MAYKILIRKPEIKRTLGGIRHRNEDDLEMDLKERGWESVEWIHLAQDRDRWRVLVNTVMSHRFP
jgi:hypothetical protein